MEVLLLKGSSCVERRSSDNRRGHVGDASWLQSLDQIIDVEIADHEYFLLRTATDWSPLRAFANGRDLHVRESSDQIHSSPVWSESDLRGAHRVFLLGTRRVELDGPDAQRGQYFWNDAILSRILGETHVNKGFLLRVPGALELQRRDVGRSAIASALLIEIDHQAFASFGNRPLRLSNLGAAFAFVAGKYVGRDTRGVDPAEHVMLPGTLALEEYDRLRLAIVVDADKELAELRFQRAFG